MKEYIIFALENAILLGCALALLRVFTGLLRLNVDGDIVYRYLLSKIWKIIRKGIIKWIRNPYSKVERFLIKRKFAVSLARRFYRSGDIILSSRNRQIVLEDDRLRFKILLETSFSFGGMSEKSKEALIHRIVKIAVQSLLWIIFGIGAYLAEDLFVSD